MNRTLECKYCYQLDDALITCSKSTDCNAYEVDSLYVASCQPLSDDVLCLGQCSRRWRQTEMELVNAGGGVVARMVG